MKTAVLGIALLAVSAILVATGVLPVDAAADVAERVWPILLFVVTITAVTELAAEAELFRIVAERAAGWVADAAGCSGCSSCCSRWSALCSSRSTRPRCC